MSQAGKSVQKFRHQIFCVAVPPSVFWDTISAITEMGYYLSCVTSKNVPHAGVRLYDGRSVTSTSVPAEVAHKAVQL